MLTSIEQGNEKLLCSCKKTKQKNRLMNQGQFAQTKFTTGQTNTFSWEYTSVVSLTLYCRFEKAHMTLLVWNIYFPNCKFFAANVIFCLLLPKRTVSIWRKGDWPLCASLNEDINTVAHSWASCSQRKLKLMRSCGGATKLSSWHFGDFTS